jgi:hypothetical protein
MLCGRDPALVCDARTNHKSRGAATRRRLFSRRSAIGGGASAGKGPKTRKPARMVCASSDEKVMLVHCMFFHGLEQAAPCIAL